MIKKLALVISAVVFLIAAAVFFLVTSFDSWVKGSVEDNLSRLTGTSVSVEDVNISIISGKGSLTGLKINNPEGFSNGEALVLDKIRFELNLDSISMDLLPVKLIHADGAEILLERNSGGQLNYQLLSAKMDQASGEGGNPGASWDPRVKITEFVLDESKVNLSGFGANARTVNLPAIMLRDIGGTAGIPAEQVGEEILSGVFSEVISLSVKSGIQKWIENNESIPESLKELLNQGLNSIK